MVDSLIQRDTLPMSGSSATVAAYCGSGRRRRLTIGDGFDDDDGDFASCHSSLHSTEEQKHSPDETEPFS